MDPAISQKNSGLNGWHITTMSGITNLGVAYDVTGGVFPKIEKIMTMKKWTLTVENQGAQVISRACVGEGVFNPAFDVEFFDPLPTPEE
jgi:isopentenyl phosphate kinase